MNESLKKELEYRIRFEKLIFEIFTHFIGLPLSGTDEGICNALQKIGEFAEVDRSYIFLYHDNNNKMTNTHEWVNKGIKPHINRLQNIDVDTFPWFNKQMKQKKIVYFSKIEEIPKIATRFRKEMLIEGIKSLITVPIIYQQKLIGFLGFDSVKKEKKWEPEIISLLKIIGEMFFNVIERRKSEDALRESENHFKGLLENVELIAIQLDTKGNITFVNDYLLNVTGWKASEIIGKNWFKTFLPKEVSKKVLKVFTDSLKQGAIRAHYENPILSKNGDRRDVLWNNTVLKDFEGNMTGIASIGEDLTERKRVEDILKNLATLFASIRGNEFFNKVCVHVAKILDAEYAFVGSITPDKQKVIVIGGTDNGKPIGPMEYDLAETPCKKVVGKKACVFQSSVQKLFPKDKLLVEMGAESYAGIPLYSRAGKPFGIFVVISKKPIRDKKMAISMMNGYSERLSAEIERSKAESALKESERKYRAFFENVNDAIYMINPENQKIIDCNDKAAKMVGYSKNEILEMTMAQLHPKEEKSLLEEKFKEVSKKGSLSNISGLHHKTKKGKLIDIEVNSSMIKMDDHLTNISVIRDVTDRNKEAAVRFRLSSILENTNDFVGFVSNKGLPLYVNKAGRNICGIAQNADITKYKISDFHTKWAAEKVLREGIPTAIKKGIWTGETALLSKSGKEIPTIQTIIIHKNSEGEIEFMSTIIHDISDVKEKENLLRETEEKFRNTFKNAPIGMGLVKPSGEIFEINKKWAQMLGYTQDELINKYFKQITHPDDVNKSLRAQKDLLTGSKKKITFEKRYMHRNGNIVWAQVDVVLLRDKNNKPMYFITQVVDITKRKKSEQEILEKDMAIRKAYVDVFSAVTGGKLIIMTPEEIQASLGQPLTREKTITSYKELASTRKIIRDTTAKYFPSIKEPDQIILATGEAVTNAVKHAQLGTVQIYKKGKIAQFVIEDFGEGINFSQLPRATLLSGYSTKQTLGMGFNIMLEYSDRLLLSSQPGYTAIVIEISSKSLSEVKRREQVLAND